MNKLIPVLMAMLLLAGAGSAAGYTTITALEAYSMLDPNSSSYNADAYIIDVRHESEWLAGHAGKSSSGQGEFLESPVRKVFNIPSFSYNDLFDVAVNSLFDHNDYLIVMCGSGYRSQICSAHLESMDFNHIFNMDLGLIGWNNANLPTNNDPAGVFDPQSVVPLPGTILLLGSGLLSLGAWRSLRKH